MPLQEDHLRQLVCSLASEISCLLRLLVRMRLIFVPLCLHSCVHTLCIGHSFLFGCYNRTGFGKIDRHTSMIWMCLLSNQRIKGTLFFALISYLIFSIHIRRSISEPLCLRGVFLLWSKWSALFICPY